MPLDLRGRVAHEAPSRPPIAWKCPACGQQQTGRPEQGCPGCGAGAPGQFVGVDPVVRKGAPDAVERPTASGVADVGDPRTARSGPDLHPRAAVPPVAQLVAAGFGAWLRPLRDQLDPAIHELLEAAYTAGFYYARGQMVEAQTPQEPALTGTAESRTVIAALKLFVEQVLPQAEEEIAAGEFLGIEETQALIARWERAH